MKTVIFLLAMLMTLSVSGQNYQSGNIKTKSEKVYTLSKKQNEDIKKAAIAKVKRFQENCKLIGRKEIPYSDKTCTGGYIDVAMQDFLEGAQIEITNFDGTGEPVIGANVVVKGTTNGTITDFDGNYTIEGVPADGILVFSYIGYLSQEIPVGNQSAINVTLKEENTNIPSAGTPSIV